MDCDVDQGWTRQGFAGWGAWSDQPVGCINEPIALFVLKNNIRGGSEFGDDVSGVIMLMEPTRSRVKAEALHFVMGGNAFGEGRFEPAGLNLLPVNIITH